MNLTLSAGWPGVLVASAIAFLAGVAMWLLWRWIGRRAGWPEARSIGWACVTAVAIAAGVDSWNLFHLGVARLESPVYARIALSKIHDPDYLGTRVVMEWAGALVGVVAAWAVTRRGEHTPG